MKIISGIIPKSEPVKLILMIGILLVLVTFYGMMSSSYCRFILLPFIIAGCGWFICRLSICIIGGIFGIIRGIGK